MSMEGKRIPIREGLLTTPLAPIEKVTLVGSKCAKCGEISLGKRVSCSHCGGNRVEEMPLSKRGKLWNSGLVADSG
jgi:uncharacterized OB-fold protein